MSTNAVGTIRSQITDSTVNKNLLSPQNIGVSLNFIRLLRVVITPSVERKNDSKQLDEFQAISVLGNKGNQ